MSIFFLALSLVLLSSPCSSSTSNSLNKGSSLSVEKPDDVLISPNGIFSAGFYPVGDNVYCFAIWFNKPSYTVVWMANRDQPVNGRLSKLSLLNNGNLILTDAGRLTLWATDTVSVSSVQLHLYNTGNLVLRTSEGDLLWQSFDSPTDSLLPHQPLTRKTQLVSSRSQSNYSSGSYKLYFDNDNVLRLLFDGPEISSVYWPEPWLVSWDAGRSTYNNSRTAVFDSSGHFRSSDELEFWATDFGLGPQRRLTLDFDGNVRLYSLEEKTGRWVVSWQAISKPCKNIHGICGPNSLCTYVPGSGSGRKCSCLPGFKMRNRKDWSYGCEPESNLPCNDREVNFLRLSHVEFYGYDYSYFPNNTLEWCEKKCLELCCKGFQYKFDGGKGFYSCFPKSLLLNGHRSPDFEGDLYVRLPKGGLFSPDQPDKEFRLDCNSGEVPVQLNRTYEKSPENGSLKFMLSFACAVGGVEMICILFHFLFGDKMICTFTLWRLLFRAHQDLVAAMQGYLLAPTGFKRFTYAELKRVTQGFSKELGRGGSGVVYKGVLSNHREAAIKRLNEANQGEAEFLAEVSTIGRLNHMNLIEMWGYCAEGKHRLLVYEYMEHGSLAENLSSNALDWEKRFEIAVGTAKGLAYLHEECLEWFLHCDVKPQNILLDSNYKPKVADFGLSKLVNRGGINNSSFSRMRGAIGYTAPEWAFNLPSNSKLDVYSYGIVVLEMVTGKSPATGVYDVDSGAKTEHRRLVTWMREKMNGATAMASWMEEIIDPTIQGKYDMGKMEILVGVALQCVEEDKDARPTMSQVVEMLLRNENDY